MEWPSVEHYYQAHKFSSQHANAQLAVEAVQVMSEIAAAPSPEEAARIGTFVSVIQSLCGYVCILTRWLQSYRCMGRWKDAEIA